MPSATVTATLQQYEPIRIFLRDAYFQGVDLWAALSGSSLAQSQAQDSSQSLPLARVVAALETLGMDVSDECILALTQRPFVDPLHATAVHVQVDKMIAACNLYPPKDHENPDQRRPMLPQPWRLADDIAQDIFERAWLQCAKRELAPDLTRHRLAPCFRSLAPAAWPCSVPDAAAVSWAQAGRTLCAITRQGNAQLFAMRAGSASPAKLCSFPAFVPGVPLVEPAGWCVSGCTAAALRGEASSPHASWANLGEAMLQAGPPATPQIIMPRHAGESATLRTALAGVQRWWQGGRRLYSACPDAVYAPEAAVLPSELPVPAPDHFRDDMRSLAQQLHASASASQVARQPRRGVGFSQPDVDSLNFNLDVHALLAAALGSGAGGSVSGLGDTQPEPGLWAAVPSERGLLVVAGCPVVDAHGARVATELRWFHVDADLLAAGPQAISLGPPAAQPDDADLTERQIADLVSMPAPGMPPMQVSSAWRWLAWARVPALVSELACSPCGRYTSAVLAPVSADVDPAWAASSDIASACVHVWHHHPSVFAPRASAPVVDERVVHLARARRALLGDSEDDDEDDSSSTGSSSAGSQGGCIDGLGSWRAQERAQHQQLLAMSASDQLLVTPAPPAPLRPAMLPVYALLPSAALYSAAQAADAAASSEPGAATSGAAWADLAAHLDALLAAGSTAPSTSTPKSKTGAAKSSKPAKPAGKSGAASARPSDDLAQATARLRGHHAGPVFHAFRLQQLHMPGDASAAVSDAYAQPGVRLEVSGTRHMADGPGLGDGASVISGTVMSVGSGRSKMSRRSGRAGSMRRAHSSMSNLAARTGGGHNAARSKELAEIQQPPLNRPGGDGSALTTGMLIAWPGHGVHVYELPPLALAPHWLSACTASTADMQAALWGNARWARADGLCWHWPWRVAAQRDLLNDAPGAADAALDRAPGDVALPGLLGARVSLQVARAAALSYAAVTSLAPSAATLAAVLSHLAEGAATPTRVLSPSTCLCIEPLLQPAAATLADELLPAIAEPAAHCAPVWRSAAQLPTPSPNTTAMSVATASPGVAPGAEAAGGAAGTSAPTSLVAVGTIAGEVRVLTLPAACRVSVPDLPHSAESAPMLACGVQDMPAHHATEVGPATVTAMSLSADGRWCVSGTAGGQVHVYDVPGNLDPAPSFYCEPLLHALQALGTGDQLAAKQAEEALAEAAYQAAVNVPRFMQSTRAAASRLSEHSNGPAQPKVNPSSCAPLSVLDTLSLHHRALGEPSTRWGAQGGAASWPAIASLLGLGSAAAPTSTQALLARATAAVHGSTLLVSRVDGLRAIDSIAVLDQSAGAVVGSAGMPLGLALAGQSSLLSLGQPTEEEPTSGEASAVQAVQAAVQRGAAALCAGALRHPVALVHGQDMAHDDQGTNLVLDVQAGHLLGRLPGSAVKSCGSVGMFQPAQVHADDLAAQPMAVLAAGTLAMAGCTAGASVAERIPAMLPTALAGELLLSETLPIERHASSQFQLPAALFSLLRPAVPAPLPSRLEPRTPRSHAQARGSATVSISREARSVALGRTASHGFSELGSSTLGGMSTARRTKQPDNASGVVVRVDSLDTALLKSNAAPVHGSTHALAHAGVLQTGAPASAGVSASKAPRVLPRSSVMAGSGRNIVATLQARRDAARPRLEQVVQRGNGALKNWLHEGKRADKK